jgi:protein-disulfide isomerase
MHRVPIGTSPILGRRDALVTIVEFGDLQCPFCKRAETTLAALRVKYGADLRIVWKNEPLAFHKRALPAGELAYEARDEHGDAAFWTVHDAIYASSPSLEDGDLLRIALDHGINATNVARAISTSRHKPLFDADIALAAKVGATGTPTFFVNGQRLQGAQPQATFESVIDERLTDARARVARGTRREDVYDAVMTDIIE